MDYKYFEKLQMEVNGSSNYGFQPVVNIFKNGIIINYYKVGTRFLESVLTNDDETHLNQIPFIFLNENSFHSTLKPIKYHFNDKFVLAPWIEGKDYINIKYKKWNSDDTFLDSQGYSNYTDFFFNNDKEIIFLIRNPIHRFFSGLIQILSFDYREKVTLDKFGKILRENFDQLIHDIHTVNYLHHYKEMIYNIQDKSKIKIIDLSQLKSKNACNLLCNLTGDKNVNEIYSDLSTFINSNRKKYSHLYKIYEKVHPDSSIFIQYIKEEYSTYMDLKNSKYFLDLS